jgi:hypothetical protein
MVGDRFERDVNQVDLGSGSTGIATTHGQAARAVGEKSVA